MYKMLFNQDITIYNYVATDDKAFYKRTFIKNCHYEKRTRTEITKQGVQQIRENFIIIRDIKNYIPINQWNKYSAENPEELNKWTLTGGGGELATYIIKGDFIFDFDMKEPILSQIEQFEKELKQNGIEWRRVKEYEEFLNISPMINHVEVIC